MARWSRGPDDFKRALPGKTKGGEAYLVEREKSIRVRRSSPHVTLFHPSVPSPTEETSRERGGGGGTAASRGAVATRQRHSILLAAATALVMPRTMPNRKKKFRPCLAKKVPYLK